MKVPARGAPPPDVLARLRLICLEFPEAREEAAWAGIRWNIGPKNFAHALAIDDKRAVKKLKAFGLQLTLHSTESIVLLLIQHSILTIAAADAMKLEWEQNHRFRLPFGSFSERVSSAP